VRSFDIVRDFFQNMSLFFSHIGAAAKADLSAAMDSTAAAEAQRGAAAVMHGAQAFFGNIAQITSVDFGAIASSPKAQLAMYYILAILAIVFIIVSIYFIRKANEINPDEIRDGHVGASRARARAPTAHCCHLD
jgi:hypothetical protein